VHAQAQDEWIEKLNLVSARSFALNPLDNNIVYTVQNDTFVVSYDGGETWRRRGYAWQPFGKSIVVSQADTNRMIMHTGGGIFRTSNGGRNWFTTSLGASMNGETLAWDPHLPQTAYVADFLSGDFYVTENNGVDWTLRSNLGTPIACSVAPHPTIPGLIIAGAGSGRIARTTDGGFTWSLARQEDTYTLETPMVKWDKSSPNLAYASTYGGLFACFRSENYGESWINAGPLDVNMWGMNVNPDNGSVYLGSFNANSGAEGAWASYDSGKSFQRTAQSTTPLFDDAVMIKVADNGAVFILNDSRLFRIDPKPVGQVRGRVFDVSGTQPLIYGELEVLETGDYLFFNNIDGGYALNLPAGSYSISASYLDSISTVANVVVANGQVTNLDFTVPIVRSVGSVSGVVSSSLTGLIEGTVTLKYQNEFGNNFNLSVNPNANGEFSFDGISTLSSFDSLAFIPNTAPFLKWFTTDIQVDSFYSIQPEPANSVVSAITESSAMRIARRLNANDLSSFIWSRTDRGQEPAVDIINLTTAKSLFWVGEDDNTVWSSATGDSLVRIIEMGNNVFLSGQNLLEQNSQLGFFQNTLGVAFAGNYVLGSTFFKGFPGSDLGVGLFFPIPPGGQSSRDMLSFIYASGQKELFYGISDADTSNIAGISLELPAYSGKAVVLGFDLGFAPVAAIDTFLLRTTRFFDSVVAVEPHLSGLPQEAELYQNYPNPFNPTTTIRYQISKKSNVKLIVFDVLGRKVKTLLNSSIQPGNHSVQWNGLNEAHNAVGSGVYFYKLDIEGNGNHVLFRKMLLIR